MRRMAQRDDKTFWPLTPGDRVRLTEIDPADTAGLEKGKEVSTRVDEATERLTELQERLFAEAKRSVLVVLQAMDAGGKDGTIRKVMGPLNSASCYVANFKKPSSTELAHDFLWRIHQVTPKKGEIAIFNRSHYEDVLVVKVHGLVDEETVKKRYAHINDFERMLSESGTRIVKFMLHISKDEQKERMQARMDDPTKHWKLSPVDFEERKRWDEYMAAFEAALSATTTPWAPWYVVPANKKWFRDLFVAETLVRVLEEMNPRYPAPAVDVSKLSLE